MCRGESDEIVLLPDMGMFRDMDFPRSYRKMEHILEEGCIGAVAGREYLVRQLKSASSLYC